MELSLALPKFLRIEQPKQKAVRTKKPKSISRELPSLFPDDLTQLKRLVKDKKLLALYRVIDLGA